MLSPPRPASGRGRVDRHGRPQKWWWANCTRLPHLVELPAPRCGRGHDRQGRALLVDIAIDTTPSGYRIAARPGAVSRRVAQLPRRGHRRARGGVGARGAARRRPHPQAPSARSGDVGGAAGIAERTSSDHRPGGAAGPDGRRWRKGSRCTARKCRDGWKARWWCSSTSRRCRRRWRARLTGVTALTPVHPVDETSGGRTAGRMRGCRRRRSGGALLCSGGAVGILRRSHDSCGRDRLVRAGPDYARRPRRVRRRRSAP